MDILTFTNHIDMLELLLPAASPNQKTHMNNRINRMKGNRKRAQKFYDDNC